MSIPKDVGVDNIQATILSLPYEIFPHLVKHGHAMEKISPFAQNHQRNLLRERGRVRAEETVDYIRGASWVVNGAGDEDSPLAIDDEGLPVVGHAALDQLEPTNNEEQEGEEEGER